MPLAEQIVEAFIKDNQGRRGVPEWDMIPQKVQIHLQEQWINMIEHVLHQSGYDEQVY